MSEIRKTKEYFDFRRRRREKLALEAQIPKLTKRIPSSDIDFSPDSDVKIMASMVPDEIIFHGNDYTPMKFRCAMIFADVSGFTDLSQKYNKSSQGGASKLSYVLNTYIGNMIQEILSHGGDVLKFSGDAFLVMFKVTASASLQDAINEAIDTAIIVQKSYGKYETDVGVTLRVKIAISAGDVHFSLIGTEKMSHYIVIGEPIWEVKAGESLCKPGDIIITTKSFETITTTDYTFELMHDKMHYKLKDFSDSWRFGVHKYSFVNNLMRQRSDSGDYTITGAELYMLRPSVYFATNEKIDNFLKRFMIKPLMYAIETKDPLEFLTEMRQVVIVFLNLVTTPSLTSLEMIKVVNEAYTTLCKIVNYHEGVVNKVSLFDKDVMFLILFGLPGLKHDLESQIALRCAADIHNTLKNMSDVKSASIGVTTGLTYCGVVGHSLRREYSAISIYVNKAARLMMAYPGKVTCDQDTFVHSRMNAMHFKLQKVKTLKGLDAAGPVYQFVEVMIPQVTVTPSPLEYPLLGRDDFLHIFLDHFSESFELFKKAQTNSSADIKSCILIKGETRQGKSRLTDEIFHKTFKSEMNCVKISLHISQVRKPFSTTALYMAIPLGITPGMDMKAKEDIIREKLKKFEVRDSLFVLNSIFDVSFNPTKNLSPDKLTELRRNIFKLLLEATFLKFWLIILDDIEVGDEESFLLFDVLFEIRSVFCIFTMGNRRKTLSSCENILKNDKILIFTLQKIKKMYQTALACQLLNVVAVPLEIERIVHTQSGGNPGWLETFLNSLIQDGGLQLKDMEVDKALELGLVFTEPAFMTRTSTVFRRKQSDIPRTEEWNMFSYCFNESTENLSYKKYVAKHFSKEGVSRVAIITPDFYLKDFNSELIISKNLIIYDSLSSFQQLTLKCASVLGENILRSMMNFVMSKFSQRNISLAFKRFFELKVLSCSMGNFSSRNSIFQKNMKVEDSDEVKCSCINLPIDGTCKDLPKYSMCGYSKFNSTELRDTIYNLLTDRQKTEFHNRALIYIERETRRCASCGSGNIQNMKASVEFTTQIDELLLENLDDVSNVTENEHSSFESISGSSGKSTMSNPFPCLMLKCEKRSKALPEIPSYSFYDFSNCECDMILYEMHTQTLQHNLGAGVKQKIVESKIEYASICHKVLNIPKAMNLLNEVLLELESFDKKNSLSTSFYYGRAFTILGQCYFDVQQYSNASTYFYKACQIMGVNFPSTEGCCTSLKIKSAKQRVKSKLNEKSTKIYMATYMNLIVQQLSECLCSMFNLFKHMKKWKLAELAAFYGLLKALKCSNAYSVIMGFANVLLISFKLGYADAMYWMQIKSLETLSSLTDVVTSELQTAILKMYKSLFYCLSGKSKSSTNAIDLGMTILNSKTSMKNISIKWKVIPCLIHLLNSQNRLPEALSILFELKELSEKNTDRSGLIWFYALCLDIHLDTGYSIISYKNCLKFHTDELESNKHFINDLNSIRRFYANLLLICVRRGNWESGKFWETEFNEFFVLLPEDLNVNVLTALRALEGKMLEFIYAIESRNLYLIISLQKSIKHLINGIRSSRTIDKSLRIHFAMLKIFYKQVRRFDKGNISKMRKLVKIAKAHNFLLYADLLTHNIRNWKFELSSFDENFWKEHASSKNLYSWKNYENDQKIYPFSLPLTKVKMNKNLKLR